MKRSIFILALALLAATAVYGDTEWVCPMPEHPAVFAQPGKCLQCGMSLVSKKEVDRQLALAAAAWEGKGAGANLKPPKEGKIRVAVAISQGATMIDFAGPWEVFQDVDLPRGGGMSGDTSAFELYTVAATRDPVRASAGLKILPDYTFDDAPVPHVIIVPAQRGSAELHAWLRKMAPQVDVLASVCTGAFQVARAGLLDGKEATTHHDFYDAFASSFPKVKLVRSLRYVDSDAKLSTAGGLTSGIDLALHIVERYFGRDVAARTAVYMEYTSDGWRQPQVAAAKKAAK